MRIYARELGEAEAVGLLQKTLDAKITTDEALTKLAVMVINTKALVD